MPRGPGVLSFATTEPELSALFIHPPTFVPPAEDPGQVVTEADKESALTESMFEQEGAANGINNQIILASDENETQKQTGAPSLGFGKGRFEQGPQTRGETRPAES